MKKRAFRLLLAVIPLLTFTLSCSQCGGAMSKAEYIKILDAECKEFYDKTKGKGHELRDLAGRDMDAFLHEVENLFAETRKVNENLAAIKRPIEDSAMLTEFWNEVWAIDRLGTQFVQQMREVAKVTNEAHNKNMKDGDQNMAQAIAIKMQLLQKDLLQTQNKMNDAAKKYADLARKYGFKECGAMEVGFSGQMQAK